MVEIFSSINTTCEEEAVLSQYWSSTSSDLDRDGRSWKENRAQYLSVIINLKIMYKLILKI